MNRLFRLSPVFLFLVFPAPRLWCQSLTIQEIEWTDSVSANRLATTTYGKKASVNSLVIWIKTRCDSSVYAKLRQAKKLPVSFHWYYKPEGGSWLGENYIYPTKHFAYRPLIDFILHSTKYDAGYNYT